MGIRSQNNPIAAYLDVFSNTGTDSAAGGGGGVQIGSPTGLTATGGVISDYVSGTDVYRAHVFTSSGNFAVTALSASLANTLQILAVAGGGGGGGGQYHGGGGGAGGLLEGSITVPAVPTSYAIQIGAGGGGDAGGGSGSTGANTVFLDPRGPTTFTASGGGGGAYAPGGNGGVNGLAGGSGGGAGGVSQPGGGGVSNDGPGTQANQPGANGTLTGYGNDGGGPNTIGAGSPYFAGGGGGGAGAVGYPGNNPEPSLTRGCLLYTSPSPRDLSTSRMPSSA